jgi:hypothetical protein
MPRQNAWIILAFLFTPALLHPLEWALIRHPYAIDKMRQEIDSFWKKGFYPVGLSVVPPPAEQSGSYVLYLKGGPFTPARWTIRRYSDLTAVREDIQDKVDSGWTPQDISVTGSDLYVLYLSLTNRVKEWRIEACGNGLEDIRNAVEPLFREEFIPMGLSLCESGAWVLAVKIDGLSVRRWQITECDADDDLVKDNTDAAVASGWTPWGISLSESRLRMLFVKFRD